MPNKVGIFSGSFDPIHEGHVHFAKEAVLKCGLDKVFFMVEPRPRRKQGVRAFQHRVNMVQLAIEDEPKLGLIILEQQKFTVPETMPILASRFKGAKISLLIGEDVLFKLIAWPQVNQLVNSVDFIIGTRHNQKELKKHIAEIEKLKGKPLSHKVFETELSTLSSSEIRQALRRKKIPEGINPEVLAYIQLNGLYAPTDT